MANNSKNKAAKTAAIRRDLERQLEAAVSERESKLAQSKDHLASMLRVAGEKYHTVNGFMQVRSTLEQVLFGEESVEDASLVSRELAMEMSALATSLADKLDEMGGDDVDESFIDGLMDAGFVFASHTPAETAKQVLIVNLLQNVGPSIDDIVGYRTRADAEITKISEELDKHAPAKKAPALKVVK